MEKNYLLGVLNKRDKKQKNSVGLLIAWISIVPQRAFGIKIE